MSSEFETYLNEVKTQDSLIKLINQSKSKWNVKDVVDLFYTKLPRKIWNDIYNDF